MAKANAMDKLMEQLNAAVASGDANAVAEASKAFVKAKAEADKANAEAYAGAKADCATWLAEKIANVVAEAAGSFDIGEAIKQIRWTAAGFVGSDGEAQTNNSCAINPKRGGGNGGTGSSIGGSRRGNFQNTGMDTLSYVEANGTDEEIASYKATDEKNAKYSLAMRIYKRNNS